MGSSLADGRLSTQDMADMQVFMDQYQGNPTQLSPAQCLALMERIVRAERLLKESIEAGKRTHEALMFGVKLNKQMETKLRNAEQRIKELQTEAVKAIPITQEDICGEKTGGQTEAAVQRGRADGVQVPEVERAETPEVSKGPDGG